MYPLSFNTKYTLNSIHVKEGLVFCLLYFLERNSALRDSVIQIDILKNNMIFFALFTFLSFLKAFLYYYSCMYYFLSQTDSAVTDLTRS